MGCDNRIENTLFTFAGLGVIVMLIGVFVCLVAAVLSNWDLLWGAAVWAGKGLAVAILCGFPADWMEERRKRRFLNERSNTDR